mmetsp:Transcript_123500/g.395009  ORF Transcript_123500/g.395009 Transcript_123500/m.395009 type:complete len:243 (+) Transcript_123500:404-1132(+)
MYGNAGADAHGRVQTISPGPLEDHRCSHCRSDADLRHLLLDAALRPPRRGRRPRHRCAHPGPALRLAARPDVLDGLHGRQSPPVAASRARVRARAGAALFGRPAETLRGTEPADLDAGSGLRAAGTAAVPPSVRGLGVGIFSERPRHLHEHLLPLPSRPQPRRRPRHPGRSVRRLCHAALAADRWSLWSRRGLRLHRAADAGGGWRRGRARRTDGGRSQQRSWRRRRRSRQRLAPRGRRRRR